MSITENGGSLVGGLAATPSVSGEAILRALMDPEGLRAFATQAEATVSAANAQAAAILASAGSERAQAQAALSAAREQAKTIVDDANAAAEGERERLRAEAQAADADLSEKAARLAELRAEIEAAEARMDTLDNEVATAFEQREQSVGAIERAAADLRAEADSLRESAGNALNEANAARALYEGKVAALLKIIED